MERIPRKVMLGEPLSRNLWLHALVAALLEHALEKAGAPGWLRRMAGQLLLI